MIESGRFWTLLLARNGWNRDKELDWYLDEKVSRRSESSDHKKKRKGGIQRWVDWRVVWRKRHSDFLLNEQIENFYVE